MLKNTKKHNRINVINYNNGFNDLVLSSPNKYQPIHRWYQLVEGFSSELVRRIIGEQKSILSVCLDPFGGVGTTALTCQDLGIKCISYENNPFIYDLARTKLRTDYDSTEFEVFIDKIEDNIASIKTNPKLPELESKTFFESKDKERWIFDLQVAYGIYDILTYLERDSEKLGVYKGLFRVALASILIQVSNVFRNGKCLSYKNNWTDQRIRRKDVHNKFINVCRNLLLIDIRTSQYRKPFIHNYVNYKYGDTRNLLETLKDDSIDLVITSPPYLNSRDYADIYRLELWILGYFKTFEEEQKIRRSAIRSHVQTKWKATEYPKIKELDSFLRHIKGLNGSLWNNNIPNMITGYFADMHKILKDMRPKIRKGGRLYINVANSAYGNKTCEVDVIIAKIARQVGFVPIEIREVRHVKSSRQQKEVDKLRESIIVLESV